MVPELLGIAHYLGGLLSAWTLALFHLPRWLHVCGAGRCPLNAHRLLYSHLPSSENPVLGENILKVSIAHCLSILVVGLPAVVRPLGFSSAC